MDEIRVTFAEIDNARRNIGGTQQQIGQQLDDLKRFVAPLVADWTGQAAENYQVQQLESDKAWRDLNQVLAQIGVLVGQAHHNYLQTENAIANSWKA